MVQNEGLSANLTPEHPDSGLRHSMDANAVIAPGQTLSVVIPAYNEGQRLGQTLAEIRVWLDKFFSRRYEVLVVDDGSRDNTAELAEHAAAQWENLRLLRQPRNLGKGAAVRRGCLDARNDYVLFMDADHATPIEELRAFFPPMERGYDIVVAVRAFQESESRSRRIMGLGLLMLAHLIVFSKAVVDSQCGFKLFRRHEGRDQQQHASKLNQFMHWFVTSLPGLFGERLLILVPHAAQADGQQIQGVEEDATQHVDGRAGLVVPIDGREPDVAVAPVGEEKNFDVNHAAVGVAA